MFEKGLAVNGHLRLGMVKNHPNCEEIQGQANTGDKSRVPNDYLPNHQGVADAANKFDKNNSR
jgi:hypothetical protein